MLTEPGRAAMANSFSGGVFENNAVDSIVSPFFFVRLLSPRRPDGAGQKPKKRPIICCNNRAHPTSYPTEDDSSPQCIAIHGPPMTIFYSFFADGPLGKKRRVGA
ncbi:MAG: hypothetical protein ACLUFV_02610 [Acutalibacteraceae bacterium]